MKLKLKAGRGRASRGRGGGGVLGVSGVMGSRRGIGGSIMWVVYEEGALWRG